MRYFLCAALFCSLLGAQDTASVTPLSPHDDGTFYVNGIDYHYISGTNYTVVVAAHSVANRKFLGVKVRILNNGQRAVTVRPEEVKVEDAVAGREVPAIAGAELANRMRHPYNWSRFAVNTAAGSPSQEDLDPEGMDHQRSDLMRAMQQMHSQMANSNAAPAISTLSLTDEDPSPTPGAMLTDEVSHLRRKEASGPDVLRQLQRQVSPDYVEQTSFRANTIPPRADQDGVFYYSMGKLECAPAASKKAAKSRLVRVTIPVGEEKFQFMIAVE
jgi:hypothetical protein